jgi:hypothetical protein
MLPYGEEYCHSKVKPEVKLKEVNSAEGADPTERALSKAVRDRIKLTANTSTTYI